MRPGGGACAHFLRRGWVKPGERRRYGRAARHTGARDGDGVVCVTRERRELLFWACFDLDPHPPACAKRHPQQPRAHLEHFTDFTAVNFDNEGKTQHSV